MDISHAEIRCLAKRESWGTPSLSRHAGKAVLAGLTVPSDDLSPLTGHPA